MTKEAEAKINIKKCAVVEPGVWTYDALKDYKVIPPGWRRRLISWILSSNLQPFLNKMAFVYDWKKGDPLPDVPFVMMPPGLLTMLRIMINPTFLFGETYIRGHLILIKGSLIEFMLMLRAYSFRREWTFWEKMRGYFSFVTYGKIAEHYDISPDFYKFFLCKRMAYSCAFYSGNDETLEQAQDHKHHLIVKRLSMKKDQSYRLLDIGCGWGAFAEHALKAYPKMTYDGISLAHNQVLFSRNRIEEMKENTRASFHVVNYKHFLPDRENIFDRICSIGMVEHLGGRKGYVDFFHHIHRLLKPGGIAVIHGMSQRRDHVGIINPWMGKYIFPGGRINDLSSMSYAYPPLVLKALNVHGGYNYFRTVRQWYYNLTERYKEAYALLLKEGCDERMARRKMRIWGFYLGAVPVTFYADDVCVLHYVLQKLDGSWTDRVKAEGFSTYEDFK